MAMANTQPVPSEVRTVLLNRLPEHRLGARIKELREAQGLTQRELGALAGCSKDYVAAAEVRTRLPDRERLYAIAQALGTDTRDLLQAAGYIEELDILAGIDPHLIAAARGAPPRVQHLAAQMLNESKRTNGDE